MDVSVVLPGHRDSHRVNDAGTATAFSKITCDILALQFDFFSIFQEGENGYPPSPTRGPQPYVTTPATPPPPFAIHPGGFKQSR